MKGAATAAIGMAAVLMAAAGAAQAPPPAPAAPVVVSTPAQRTGLDLVIYSGGFALIRERRKVSLPAGPVALRYEGVPATLEADSARLRAMGASAALQIEQQRFHPEDLTPRSLLEAYTGKTVTLTRYRYVHGHSERLEIPATLVSAHGGYIWRMNGHITVENGGGNFVPEFQVPRLPAALFAQPTLVWRLRSAKAGPAVIAVGYLAQKIYWSANYALTLNAQGNRGELAGWMTMQNLSGEAYPDARVQLVAGQVHAAAPQSRPVPQPLYARQSETIMVAAPASAAPAVTVRKVYAYHLYTIGQPVSLAPGGEEQVRWLAAAKIPVRKMYVVHGEAEYLGDFPSGVQTEPVDVALTIENRRADGLGRALPGGVVRVYGPAPGGREVFLGAARIPDTAAGGTIHLQPGGSFDISARRVQTQLRRIKQGESQATYQVTVANATGSPVRVRDDEALRGSWTITKSSQTFTQPNASTARFEFSVPAHGSASFTYTVDEAY